MPRTCDQCGETKPNKRFRQLASNPVEWSDTCLVCLHDKEEAERKAATYDRKEEKAARRMETTVRHQQRRNRAKARVGMQKLRRKRSAKTAAAERELAERELARRRIIPFIKRFNDKYDDGWVHHDICRRLEKFYQDVEDGKAPRLMLFMPPRHGKSEIASKNFPAWALGKNPELEIIASSYAVSLPIDFSRKVRGIIRDPAYKTVFPKTQLDPESSAAEGWKTKAGGGYVAAGVGGGITGKGAHIAIIDDPIKDAEEADSETIREKVWDWYGSTLYTRLAPGGGVLVIQTRWHDDDLAGRLIAELKAQIKEGAPQEEIDDWEIVSYPAIATEDEYLGPKGDILYRDSDGDTYHTLSGKVVDLGKAKARKLRRKGDALHPARFNLTRLLKIRRTLQPRHWSALYQQNPVPDEGVYFKKNMLRTVESLPQLSSLRLFAAWDLAVGEKQTNDYTVGVVGGLDWNDQMYIIDVVRFRGDTHAITEAILNLYQKYEPDYVGIEQGQIELAIGPQMKKRMGERRIYPVFDDSLRPISDKQIRARPLQGRMQQGMVYFPANAPWMEDVEHELLRFPGGVHDDIVDALAWMARMALKHEGPTKPSAKKQKSWRDKLGQYVNHSRGGGAQAA